MLVLWMLTLIQRGTHIHCTGGVDKQLIRSKLQEFSQQTSLPLHPDDERYLPAMTEQYTRMNPLEMKRTETTTYATPTTPGFPTTSSTTPPATATAGPIVYPTKPPWTTTGPTTARPVADTTVIRFIDECPDPEDFYNCTGYGTNQSRDGICFYFRYSYTLDCEDAKLTQLPKGIPKDVLTLLLSGNHILSINQWTFSEFNKLIFLDLCYGWLHDVGKNAFTYMYSLERLQMMQHHAIMQVGSLAFYELPKLKFLRIGPIQVITLDTVFFDLRNSILEYLGLYDIKFDDIRRTTFDNLKLCPLTILEIYSSEINLLDALAFSEISTLQVMVLSKTQIISVDRNAFMALGDLHSLNVTHCSIKDLSSGTFDPLKALKLLNLNGNMLETIPVDLFKYNKNLAHIDLSNNHLLTLPEGLFNFPSDIYVDLSSNFFTCDCDLAWVSSWLSALKNQTINENVLCHLPIKMQSTRLVDFKPVCIPPYTWYILSASLGLVALVGVVTLLYVHRWKLYYQWYIMLSKRKNRDVWMNHARFAFDAFVAYSERDFQWVLHELIPHLEDNAGPPHMKLCVSDRDWDLGSNILDNVESSIQRSRKTVCVISGHFLKSEWCKLEMSMAHMQLFSDNRDVLIFVFLEKIPPGRLSQHQQLRRELCKKSCLDWPGTNPVAQKLFWEKLRSLILRRRWGVLPPV